MSGKLTLDTEAGGSVTLTVDDTETGDIEYPLDSAGIESGSNINGRYIKFPDGTLICYGGGEDPMTASASEGAVFRSPKLILTFPHEFIALPNATSSSLLGGWCNVVVTTETNCELRAWAGVENQVGYPTYQAIGRWK